MGHERRLIRVGSCAALLLLGAAGACGVDREAEQRRQLLAAQARTQARLARLEQQRPRTPEGDLLPSETKIAGLVLPRGAVPKYSEPHAWTFDVRAPQAKLSEYFEQRLVWSEKRDKPLSEQEYVGVREKSAPDAVPGLLRISPTPSQREWTRIYIGEPVPEPTTVADEAQARDRMAAARRAAR